MIFFYKFDYDFNSFFKNSVINKINNFGSILKSYFVLVYLLDI